MRRHLPTGRRALSALCCALLTATGSFACGPDTEARWDEFLDESDPERQEAQAAAEQQASCDGDPCTNCDITGYHLVGLETLLGPDLPIQFMTQVTVNGGTADFSFQPLSLGVGVVDTPREEVGDPIVVTGVDISTGIFTIDFGEVTVTGMANPISGGDILATIVLDGRILSDDAWAGAVTGMATQPVAADLTGSTFGALRVADPADRPDFPCDTTMSPLVCYTTCSDLLGLIGEGE